jgi:ABC-type oligopeptide transport system substrate-binding subunit
MKRILTGLSVMALVAVLALLVMSALPAAADEVNKDTDKAVILGGTPGTYISVWRAGGPIATDSSGNPIGTMESVTPISLNGATEVFVPLYTASNIFIWDPNKGYTFLQTVAPSSADSPITIAAK